jgi:tetratricopeptide (TPR) repeat protein
MPGTLGTPRRGVQGQRSEAVDSTGQGRRGAPSLPPPVPPSLLAVCRQALALDRGHRYARVEDLQADLSAYQNGFATSAERAGAWKLFTLFIKRHKVVAASAALIVVITLGFLVKVMASERRATANEKRALETLGQLRATAPTFFEQAKLLTAQERLPEALEKIGIALKLNPDEAGFHAQRGNILQSMERFADAADAYAAALRLNEQEPHAAENLALSRALAAAREKDGTLPARQRSDWRDALVQQGRMAEAIFAGRALAADVAKMLPAWQAKIDAWLGKNAPRVTLGLGGGYELDLSNRSLTDLSPLRSMPLYSLHISGNPQIKDLNPLADSPTLRGLDAARLPGLVDLSPLKGLKLTVIYLDGTGVRDLAPLAGMPLEDVYIRDTAISDLTPLRGANLRKLEMTNTAVRSLEPLRGQPLTDINMMGAPVTSLDPVGDAPLSFLHLSSHVDLASLRQHQLRNVYAFGATLDHLEVLAEMTELEMIVLPGNFTDAGLLRKLPHLRKVDFDYNGQTGQLKDAADFFRQYDAPEVRAVRAALAAAGLKEVPPKSIDVDPTGRLRVNLYKMPITDLASLRGQPIQELNLNDTAISDLEPLRGMPLDTLFLNHTNANSLEPIRGAPLRRVALGGSKVSDVGILADFPDLEEIGISNFSKNIERLRTLKKLRLLSMLWDSSATRPMQTAEEFWKAYDAKKAAGGQ